MPRRARFCGSYEYPSRYTISYPAGPRSTPEIHDGRVYTIGAMGQMFCFDAKTGTVLWSKDFVKDYKTTLPIWGMVASPLVDGDQLITLVGGENAFVVSFDKATGRERWRALDDPEVGYSPPVIFTINGKRHLVVWHPRSITGLDPNTGKLLWDVPYSVKAGLCIATPRNVGNRIFVTSFYNGPRMIEIGDDGKSAKILWQGHSDSEIMTDGLHSIIPTPVFDGTHIYGVCSYGQLRCLDASNGKRLVGNAGRDRQGPLVERVPHSARGQVLHPQRAGGSDHRQAEPGRLRRDQPCQTHRADAARSSGG